MTSSRDKYRPLAGHALLEIESRYGEQEGGILIPEMVRRVKGKVGTVIAVTLPDEMRPEWKVWKGHKMVRVRTRLFNDFYREIEGKRMIAEHGREFSDGGKTLCVCRLEHLAAFAEGTAPVKLSSGTGIERCPRCRSTKGEGNVLLDNHGYCLQCGLNAAGEHRDHREMKVSDEEANSFGLSAEEQIERNDPNRRRTSNRVYSVAGKKFKDPVREVSDVNAD